MFQRPDQVHDIKEALAIHRAVGPDRPDAKSGRYRTHAQYEQMREDARHSAMQKSAVVHSLPVPTMTLFASLVCFFLVASDSFFVHWWRAILV